MGRGRTTSLQSGEEKRPVVVADIFDVQPLLRMIEPTGPQSFLFVTGSHQPDSVSWMILNPRTSSVSWAGFPCFRIETKARPSQ